MLRGILTASPTCGKNEAQAPLFCGSKLEAVSPGPEEGLRLSEKAVYIGKQEVIEGLQQGSLYPALLSSQRVTQGLLPGVGETGSHRVAEAGLVFAAFLRPPMLGSQICTTMSSQSPFFILQLLSPPRVAPVACLELPARRRMDQWPGHPACLSLPRQAS